MNPQPEPVQVPAATHSATAACSASRAAAPDALQAIRRGFDRVEHDGLIAAGILALAVGLNLFALRHEVAIQVPALNDMVMHLQVLERTIAALVSGQNLSDPWMGTVPALGYPLFHYYQHLPYFPTAALYLLLSIVAPGAVTPATALNWSGYLLLSLFPLSIYWSMRRFGFSRLEAAFAGLAGSLLSTNFLYGLEYGSYIWRGNGMYTQLWGMLLLPMALAQSYIVLREGRGYFWAVLLVAATVLSHVVSGYVALGSIVLLAMVVAWETREAEPHYRGVWRTFARLAVLLLFVALVISYFLIPFVRDSAYMNRSVWELQEKYDSYGAPAVLDALFRGQLLDFGRFPSLSLLAALGLAVSLWRWRQAQYRIPVVLALFWLLLYFGRPTWGVLLNLLPLSENLHLHRLIIGFHLGTIYLIGIGLALPWSWALASSDRRNLIVPFALTVLLLFPVYQERAAYLDLNQQWMARSAAAYAAEAKDLAALEETLAAAPPGRVYAGLTATWGKDYKVGDAPMYALLTRAGFDVVGQLYQALSLNSDVQVLFQDGRQEQYNLFNIRYVLTPTDWTVPAYYKTIGDFGRHRLYEVPTTGYFDLVGSDLAFAGNKSDFFAAASAWLGSGLVAAKEHPAIYLGAIPAGQTVAPLSAAPEVLAQLPAAAELSRGRVLSESVESNAYAAEVEVERDGYVMLKATYHPDWHAIIDGVEAPTVMLMPSYVGVKVGPGTHHVRLEYRSSPLRGILMGLGLLTLAMVVVGEGVFRRRARRAGAGSEVIAPPGDEGPDRAAPPDDAEISGGTDAVMDRVPSGTPRTSVWSSLAQHLPFVGAVVVAALLAGLPLLQMKMMSGHDAPVYLTGAVEFFRGLQAGQFLPRWAPDLNFGYGEPFFIFRPPLIYYLMALPRSLGASFVASQNLACYLMLAAAGLGMYLLVAERFGKRSGLVAAVAYLFAPYMLTTLYVRQALHDFLASASLPFAFWGLFCYARSGRYRYLVGGAIALALLMLSSNTVVLMAVPALTAWAGWLSWSERSWRSLVRGLAVVVVGLGLSAFFWLPAFVEKGLAQTAKAIEGYLNYSNHFVYPSQFLASTLGYGLSVAGRGDGMSFALGPVHVVAIIAALVLLWGSPGQGKRARSWLAFFMMLLVGALFFASTWSQPIWDRAPLLQYLQFPWRFLTMAAFSSAVLCGVAFAALSDMSARYDRRLPGALLVATLAALLLWGLPKARPEGFPAFNESDQRPQAIAEQGIGITTAGEYAPRWVQQRPQAPAPEPLTFIGGRGRVLASDVSVSAQAFKVDVTEDAQMRLNTFYFPGWTLTVDGVEQPFEYDNPQGVMEFSLPVGQHEVKFDFHDAPVRAWASRLSILALLVLIAGAVGSRLRDRRSLGQSETSIQDRVAEVDQPNLSDEPAQEFPIHATLAQIRSSDRFLTVLGIYLLCFAVYLMSATGHFSSTDQVAVYMTTQSLVERGDLAIEPINDTVQGPDGRYYGVFGVGQSLGSIPLYLLGRAADSMAGPTLKAYWSGADLGIWGGSVTVFFVSLFNQFVTPLTCILVFLFGLKLGFSRQKSLFVTLVFAFGTAAWVYAREYFQHPLESLTLLAAVYVLFANEERIRPRDALLAGLALGIGLLTRVNLILMAPMLLVYLFYQVRKRGGQVLSCLTAYCVPIGLALLTYMAVNDAKFGDVLAFRPQATAAMFDTPPWMVLFGFTLSPGRSIFLYSPPVILAPFAFIRFWRARRPEALLFTAIVGVFLLTYSTFAHWHGDWAWGPRFMIPALPFLLIPLGYLLNSRRWAAALAALAVLGVAVQILGVAVNYSFVYWDWAGMNLSPETAFLWVPEISAIPMHLRALLAGRNIDLWLVWVYQNYGVGVLLLTLILPVLLLAGGLAVLWRAGAIPSTHPARLVPNADAASHHGRELLE